MSANTAAIVFAFIIAFAAFFGQLLQASRESHVRPAPCCLIAPPSSAGAVLTWRAQG